MRLFGILRTAVPIAACLSLSGCGGGGEYPNFDLRLASSGLSPIGAAGSDFGSEVVGAIFRAAKTIPAGASQSSSETSGRTDGEMQVRASYDDDGMLVYELFESEQFVARIPEPQASGAKFALFTDLLPGI